MRKIIQNTLIFMVNFYRNYLSALKLQSCRFHPTCSEYTAECLKEFGITKGIFKSAKRILKCHPFHTGGHDPVK